VVVFSFRLSVFARFGEVALLVFGLRVCLPAVSPAALLTLLTRRLKLLLRVSLLGVVFSS
jgi:hypothetical protein